MFLKFLYKYVQLFLFWAALVFLAQLYFIPCTSPCFIYNGTFVFPVCFVWIHGIDLLLARSQTEDLLCIPVETEKVQVLESVCAYTAGICAKEKLLNNISVRWQQIVFVHLRKSVL